MKPRAIGYIRVSTSGQAIDGVSLDAQRAKIEAWCESNGYRLADVFSDRGITGKRADNQPALQRALKAACAKRGAALLVYSLSRLGRSTKDIIAIGEKVGKADVDLVSLSEQIDTTTAAGKMVFRMLAVFAEFERDLVSERTTAALAVKRANNERTGQVPYGFDLADDGVTLVPNATEQEVLADILAMREAGETLQGITDALTERGVPTKTGNATWNLWTVRGILKRVGAKRGRPAA
jgi:site-specific DNA recombinase